MVACELVDHDQLQHHTQSQSQHIFPGSVSRRDGVPTVAIGAILPAGERADGTAKTARGIQHSALQEVGIEMTAGRCGIPETHMYIPFHTHGPV